MPACVKWYSGCMPIMSGAKISSNRPGTSSARWRANGCSKNRCRGFCDGTLDAFAGTRALYLDQHLDWQFSANVGPYVGPGRQGSSASNQGPVFGDSHAWFVPYYLDIGTSASQFRRQTYAGIGYAFSWGEVLGVWRYLDYEFPSHSSSFALNGPAIAAHVFIGLGARDRRRHWRRRRPAHGAFATRNATVTMKPIARKGAA